jgi:predicted phosphodiesterase
MKRNCQYVLLLADIHANEEALVAVVEDAYRRYAGYRLSAWFLGDLFGRGPDPAAVWRTLLELQPEAMVAGNHDWGLTGRYQNVMVNGRYDGLYNPTDWRVIGAHCRELAQLRLLVLDEDDKPMGGQIFETVNEWPIVSVPAPGIYLIHGGLEKTFTPPDNLAKLYDDFIWSYVKREIDAQFTIQGVRWLQKNWPKSNQVQSLKGTPLPPQLIVVGHYHKRLFYNEATDTWIELVRLDEPYQLSQQEGTVLMSPGSVGFPREENDRDASYAVLCLENDVACSVTFHTKNYDRQVVRQRMRAKGYPEAVIRRLRLPGETEL